MTGASGFIGQALARMTPGATPLALGGDDWRERIAAMSWRGATVYHLAARAHRSGDSDAACERDNVDKTAALAEAAASGGARRLVFLSTIKVNGDETPERAFRPEDPPAPRDAYARSKAKAEQRLSEIANRAGLATTVVRSPLVIGAGAKGNLKALMRLADGPWPLPFAALDNRRTLICVEDLVELLAACASAPQAVGRLYLAGDPQPVSTTGLVAAIRRALGRPSRLFRIDGVVLEHAAALVGQRRNVRRLTRSLEADVSQTLRELPWRPSVSMDEGIARMARAYRGAEAIR